MTGSYFYKKIIIIVALFSFSVAGFFPIHTVSAIGPNPEATARIGGDPLPRTTNTPANATPAPSTPSTVSRSEDIYCMDFSPGAVVSGRAPFSMTGCIALGAYAVLGVASWVLWLSAILFNATINYTLNMAGFIKDIPIVAIGWTTFRDVTNLMFVFIILYIAINTIIGNEGYGIKKLLGKVIVGAMLINFSLFFTQAMIDASNVFALQFYHKIIQDSKGADGKAQTSSARGFGNLNSEELASIDSLDSGISAAFVNGLGLQEVWGIGKKTAASDGAQSVDLNDPKNKALGLNSNNLIIVGLGGSILVLITAFIFFAAAFMFLLRAITLVFLMILSPLAFMGNILPALGKYTGEWWGKLFNNLLFAPVYMALLYLVIHMITKGGFTGVRGGGSFYQLFTGNSNVIGAAMTFVVLNAMMVGCLLIASKFGVAGSKWAEKTGMSFASGVGMKLSGASLGIGLTRSTVGVAGSALTRVATPLASTGIGRMLGGGKLLRGGAAMQNIKIGGKSYKDKQKEADEEAKKTYDLAAETNQGRWESNNAFSARKKRNQARAYGTLGIAADRKTGLPKMETYVDKDGVTQARLKQRVMGTSAAKKRVRSTKDINEEGLQKKQTDYLVKREQDAYDNAKKVLTYAMTSGGGIDPDVARQNVQAAKEALQDRKYALGLTENPPRRGARRRP